jgi:hypothetical protein
VSVKYDVSEYFSAAVRGIAEYLADVDRAAILASAEAQELEWPARPLGRQDRHRHDAGLVLIAFELAKQRLRTPRERAINFLRLATVAQLAAKAGAKRARDEAGGYNEAEGKRQFRREFVLDALEKALGRAATNEEAFLIVGLKRPTGYRYLKRLRDAGHIKG